jgi:plasmid maintenance system antidote protein VapI
MIHKGEIVEQAVRKSGIKLSEVAKRIGVSRRHLYNLFENRDMSNELVYKIGKAIHYDFTSDLKLSGKKGDLFLKEFETSEDPESSYNSAEYWRGRYMELAGKFDKLEAKYIKLLKKR